MTPEQAKQIIENANRECDVYISTDLEHGTVLVDGHITLKQLKALVVILEDKETA